MKGTGYLTLIVVAVFFGSAVATDDTNKPSCVDNTNCKKDEAQFKKTAWNTSCFTLDDIGAFPETLKTQAQQLAQSHLAASMQYLMMSTQFSYWKTQRPGFQKLFEKLSDSAFDDAVNILKEIASRGGNLTAFNVDIPTKNDVTSELEALVKSLDIERDLAKETFSAINAASTGERHKKKVSNVGTAGLLEAPVVALTVTDRFNKDLQFANFLIEKISEKHTKEMNVLASHVHNLGKAIAANHNERDMIIYMYDTYILA